MGAGNSGLRSSHERRLGPNRRCRGQLLVAILNSHLWGPPSGAVRSWVLLLWFFLGFVRPLGRFLGLF